MGSVKTNRERREDRGTPPRTCGAPTVPRTGRAPTQGLFFFQGTLRGTFEHRPAPPVVAWSPSTSPAACRRSVVPFHLVPCGDEFTLRCLLLRAQDDNGSRVCGPDYFCHSWGALPARRSCMSVFFDAQSPCLPLDGLQRILVRIACLLLCRCLHGEVGGTEARNTRRRDRLLFSGLPCVPARLIVSYSHWHWFLQRLDV